MGVLHHYITSAAQTSLSGLLGSEYGDINISGIIGFAKKLANANKVKVKSGDTKLSTSGYGKTIKKVMVSYQISGNIIWCSPIVTNINDSSGVPIVGKILTSFGISGKSAHYTLFFCGVFVRRRNR